MLSDPKLAELVIVVIAGVIIVRVAWEVFHGRK